MEKFDAAHLGDYEKVGVHLNKLRQKNPTNKNLELFKGAPTCGKIAYDKRCFRLEKV